MLSLNSASLLPQERPPPHVCEAHLIAASLENTSEITLRDGGDGWRLKTGLEEVSERADDNAERQVAKGTF